MEHEVRKQDVGVSSINLKFDVRGRKLEVGETAPDFKMIATNFSLKSLADYEGKIKIIMTVPSLDTSVCDAGTRRFNEEAANLNDDIVVLTVSADLPFTQVRWCGAAGIENVETLSSHYNMKFSDAYGVHVLQMRYNQRAVFVLDKDNKIVYTEYVSDIDNQVDFEGALNAARQLSNA